ncbi:hypothetical protein GGI42DRAFT_353073 [Trichoderma sp. SZMC 28013]
MATSVLALEAYFSYQLRLAAIAACPAPVAAPVAAPTAANSPSGERLLAQLHSSVRGLLAHDDAAAAATADALPLAETNSVLGFLAPAVAPVWRVVAPAMNVFAGAGRPLAKRQVMLVNMVNRFLPGANPLLGFGAAAFYGWLNRG